MVQAWPRKSAKNFLSQIRKKCAAMKRTLRDLLKNTIPTAYGGVGTPHFEHLKTTQDKLKYIGKKT